MKYKILKDYVNWNRDTIKAGGTVELGETPATSFYGALLANGFIKEIEEGEFGDGDTYWCVISLWARTTANEYGRIPTI